MALFVGDGFMESALPLAILCVSSAAACGGVVVNNVLLTMGKTTVFTVTGFVSLAADLVLSFLLIGVLGSTGAALARAGVILASFAIPAWVLWKAFGQDMDWAAFTKSFAASSIMALAVVGAQLVWPGKLLLLLYVALGGVVYLGALRALKALNRGDFELVRGFIPAGAHVLVDLAQKILSS
jgi:O-antigen/teichoic acid export membrane protein